MIDNTQPVMISTVPAILFRFIVLNINIAVDQLLFLASTCTFNVPPAGMLGLEIFML